MFFFDCQLLLCQQHPRVRRNPHFDTFFSNRAVQHKTIGLGSHKKKRKKRKANAVFPVGCRLIVVMEVRLSKGCHVRAPTFASVSSVDPPPHPYLTPFGGVLRVKGCSPFLFPSFPSCTACYDRPSYHVIGSAVASLGAFHFPSSPSEIFIKTSTSCCCYVQSNVY